VQALALDGLGMEMLKSQPFRQVFWFNIRQILMPLMNSKNGERPEYATRLSLMAGFSFWKTVRMRWPAKPLISLIGRNLTHEPRLSR
jgi:hypothetical protein